jgi:hypothetical protein
MSPLSEGHRPTRPRPTVSQVVLVWSTQTPYNPYHTVALSVIWVQATVMVPRRRVDRVGAVCVHVYRDTWLYVCVCVKGHA